MLKCHKGFKPGIKKGNIKMAELENGAQNAPEITEDDIITLDLGEEGTVDTILWEIFGFEGQDYAALIPVDEDSEDLFLFEYYDISDDEYELRDIEDDEVFDRVAAEFDRLMEEIDATEE